MAWPSLFHGWLSNANPPISMGTLISGEDQDNNRLMVYETYDYGEANITEDGIVKGAPGLLGVAQVVVADDDAIVTFYDSLDDTGVILGVIVLAELGKQVYFRRPATTGIYAKWTNAGGAVSVGVL